MRTAASRSVSSDSLRAVATMRRRSFGLSRRMRESISKVFALVRCRSSNQIINGRSVPMRSSTRRDTAKRSSGVSRTKRLPVGPTGGTVPGGA